MQIIKISDLFASSHTLKNNPIVKDINLIVNFLSVGVGVVVIAMLILGGIQYSIAGANPEAVSKAKQRIINALIALVAYLFIFAFLQWLIPGGIFSEGGSSSSGDSSTGSSPPSTDCPPATRKLGRC